MREREDMVKDRDMVKDQKARKARRWKGVGAFTRSESVVVS